VLKKLAATGVLAATATGVMLLAGPANATSGSHPTSIDPCITVPGLYQPPAWCNTYAPPSFAPPTYYAPPAYYPPTTYYPGNYGWDRWHRNPWHYHH
jgi:hypothetical protein